jgi:hypothetical protein
MDIKVNKINLDELYTYKKQLDINTVKSYNVILHKIHTRIKLSSKQKKDNECCWFVIPEIQLGVPRYDVRACTAYLIHELHENGFKLQYTHPNLLFISWNHWVPDYVRTEYKQQTGIAIDGTGKELPKKEEKEIKLLKDKPHFNPTQYQPTGRLYNDELFKKIEAKSK